MFSLSIVSIRVAVDAFIGLFEAGNVIYHVTVTGNGQILRNTQKAIYIDLMQRIAQVQGSNDHSGGSCL